MDHSAKRVTEPLRTAEQGGTPETDALYQPTDRGEFATLSRVSVSELYKHAGQLERDRDEAVCLLKLYLGTSESGRVATGKRGKKLLDLADIDDLARQFLATLEGKPR